MALVSNPEQQHKNKPLQFKRGTARAFWKANLVLLEGQPAFETDTHKLKIGDGKTRYNLLPYIGDQSKGEDGKSAYQLWREAGHSGTVDDFLESLVGPSGKSTYEIWLSLGHEGTLADFLADIEGDSAYEVWLKNGNVGTVSDYLKSLEGKSAYEIWLSIGNEGTEIDFINSLKGDSAFDVWKKEYGTPDSTMDDYMKVLVTTTWDEF